MVRIAAQNVVDSLAQRFNEPMPESLHGSLNTFVVYNRRRCVTSSAKRRRKPGSTMVSQTPDGSFLDLMRNATDLLTRCGLSHVPEVGPPSCQLSPLAYPVIYNYFFWVAPLM